jgi:hypothetical protein
MGRRFLFSPKLSDGLWGPPSLLFKVHWGFIPEVKRLVHDFDHLPLSSAEVKNEWSYSSTLPICLHGVDRDNLTLPFYGE